jgi:hypothetical protein
VGGLAPLRIDLVESSSEQSVNLRCRVVDQRIDFEVEDQLRIGLGNEDHLGDATRVEVRVWPYDLTW